MFLGILTKFILDLIPMKRRFEYMIQITLKLVTGPVVDQVSTLKFILIEILIHRLILKKLVSLMEVKIEKVGAVIMDHSFIIGQHHIL